MLRAVAAVVIGAAVGLFAWLRLGSVLASFLTNLKVTPSDPLPLVVTCGVLLATALVACLVPASGQLQLPAQLHERQHRDVAR